MPALIENRPVETGLLAHHPSGVGNSAFGAGGHASGVEVFQHNGSEPRGKIKADPVVPVLADTGAMGAQGGHTASGLGGSLAAPLAAAKHPLGASLALFEGFEAGRDGKPLTRGQGQRIRHATIHANRRGDIGRGVVLNRQRKGDMPAVRGEADRGIVQLADKFAGVTKPNPSDLGQAHLRPFVVQLSHLHFPALKAERVVSTLFARAGVSGNAFEPGLIGAVEIAQSLLLTGLRDGGNPVVFHAQMGQFPRLAGVADAVPGLALEGAPMVAALLQGEGVNQAAHPGTLREQPFLRRRGLKFVTVAALDHSASIAIGPRVANMDYRTGRHVVYMLHVHWVFVTKYRRDVLSEPAIRDLRHIFAKVCRDFEVELIKCDGEDDHVHLLVHYPPKVALSRLVNSLKGVSSRLLRENRLEITGRYHKGVLWSPSYFAASCGGAPLLAIAEYVKSQREAAKGRSRVPPRPEGQSIPRGFR